MKICLILILFFLINNDAFNQDEKSLEEKRGEYLKKIEYTNKLIVNNRKKQFSTTENLKLIDHKIETRKLLINSLKNETISLNERINNTEYVINALNEDLDKLKKEYAGLVYEAYKNRKSDNIWIFIFSSENFNKAYRRYKYVLEYTKYRKKQKDVIVSIHDLLNQKNNELKKKKKEKQDLLFEYTEEANNLQKEIKEQKNIFNDLKLNEKKLKREIEENKKREKRIAEEIKKLIAARNKKKNENIEVDRIISNQFKNNYGTLQWPVNNGVIINEFGEHFHPGSEIKVNNGGIDISTENNSLVYVIYDGEVSGIYAILGTNGTVLVKHGSFFTVYQNIIDLKVKVGTKLKKGDIIGKVGTDMSTNSSQLHFEIWEGKKRVDPVLWITKK